MEDLEPEVEVLTGEIVPDEQPSPQANLDAAQAMLDMLRDETYPNITQMDLIEELLPPELVPEYLAILTEKVQNARYPSTDMLQRLQRLSGS
jgi:hypothetical protein